MTNEIQGYKCDTCEALVEEDEELVLYECQNCGTVFTRDNSYDGVSHKCPDCGKFSSKKTEHGCPECEDGELVECDVFACIVCNTLYEDEESAEECHPDPEPVMSDDDETQAD